LRSGLFNQEEGQTKSVFARENARRRLRVCLFLDELDQAINQFLTATDHVQAAFMLVFF
jgi:hypothetical protein